MVGNSSSPLSTSAKAAADAVIGFISRAENFIVSSTGVSPASGTGFCSPRSSPKTTPAMEGIPEEAGDDEHTTDAAKTLDNNKSGNNEFCIPDHTNCFQFEDGYLRKSGQRLEILGRKVTIKME